MKKILLFIQSSCPFCIRALEYQRELLERYPEYRELDIEIIDERKQRELADSYDYFFVPTYYVNGKKVHEGVAGMKDVKAALDIALGR